MRTRRYRLNDRGFTLAESLVAITVAGVVLAGLATAVRGQSKSAIFTMGTADMSQNVRGALDLFKRDVRMAGFGMDAICQTVAQYPYCPTAANVLAPVLVEAPAAGEAYRVRLRGAFSSIFTTCPTAPTSCVQTSGSSSASGTITIDPSVPLPTFTVGKYVVIESLILGSGDVRTISAWSSGTRTLTVTPNTLPSGRYVVGSPVRQIDDVLYVLDSQGLLKRTVLASGTTNDIAADQLTGANALTLQFILADGTTVADPSANLATLRGATIRMKAQGPTNSGMTPQTDATAEVRIRNLGIVMAGS